MRNRWSYSGHGAFRSAFGAGIVLLAAACSADSPTEPLGPSPSAIVPETPAFLLTSEGGQCMFDDYADFAETGGTPTCTTNDIRIARTEVTSVDGQAFDPESDELLCGAGQTVELGITLFLEETADSDREDVGIWIAEDEGNAKTGQCRHYVIDGDEPTAFNPDNDECSGVSSAAEAAVDLGILTVQCPTSGSSISIGSCIAWQIPGANDECPSDIDDGADGFRDPTVPGSPAKCTCEPFNIPIILTGKVIIEKQTLPNGAAGTFNFNQNVAGTDDFTLSDNGQKEFANVLPGTYSVSEDALAGFALKSIECTDPTTNTTVNLGTGTASINVGSGETVTCVFTNEADAVTVTKDADPEFTRTYEWNVDKVATAPTTFPLDPGQTDYMQEYKVTVTNTGYTDSEFAVSGSISILNPTGHTVTINSVTDAIAGVGSDADVVCPGTFPQTLAAGATLVCTYSDDLPDGATRLNTASVSLAGVTAAFTGTASVNFSGQAPDAKVDECVVAKDEGELGNTDPLGTICETGTTPPTDGFNAPHTFTYEFEVPTDAAACGEHTYDNTATITTNDLGLTDTDGASITVTIECPVGCTLTQGYWKTHNELFKPGQGGPAPDPDWASVGGPGATFFLSGQTWFQVFWTAPGGNVYYNLAHQYMAAVLNLTGSTPPADVQLAIDQATVLFETYTPAQILALKGKNGNTLRAEFIRLAGILGAFNEGTLGVEHCAENPVPTL